MVSVSKEEEKVFLPVSRDKVRNEEDVREGIRYLKTRLERKA